MFRLFVEAFVDFFQSSLLKHRIFLCFCQEIDFSWHVWKAKKEFFCTCENEKILMETQKIEILFCTIKTIKLKFAENLKHSIYLLFFLKCFLVHFRFFALFSFENWFFSVFLLARLRVSTNENDVRHAKWIKNDWKEVKWELGKIEQKMFAGERKSSTAHVTSLTRRRT